MRETIRDKSRLGHILESIDNVFEFIEGMTFDDYVADKKSKFAVVKNLEIIGEASYKLSNKFKEKHPEIKWEKIVKMRHVLVHGYYQIEDSIAWNTAANDLIALKEQIQTIYDNEI
ncbi:MAG: DUF86 domain-containing protein [Candidatus Symbiothrix sp.]|jgi:uncharacterized protein with HEPN domain|nr:DUF86 domain-containing protein [Candidatus Symbiothrix sp.]